MKLLKCNYSAFHMLEVAQNLLCAPSMKRMGSLAPSTHLTNLNVLPYNACEQCSIMSTTSVHYAG